MWYVCMTTAIAVLLFLGRHLEWDVLWRYREFLLKGLLTTLVLTVISISLGMIVAIALAAARLYGPRWIRYTASAIIETVRAIPQLLILLWVFFVMPELTGRKFTPELSAITALTIIAASYLAEVIRGGLMSVDRLQFESGYATGLSKASIFKSIVLPQAIRNMLPALLATWIMLFKTTTLVYVIGIIEFFHAATIVNSRELIPYTTYAMLAIVYFVCCYVIAIIVRRLDPKYVLRSA
jgi:His/Glu/Gln/Arg/opine family amino acid ABC transporter permease subunit